ncbi:hypothetical protein VTO42DRAFT_6181 [Malbranchea cinnamomea]
MTLLIPCAVAGARANSKRARQRGRARDPTGADGSLQQRRISNQTDPCLAYSLRQECSTTCVEAFDDGLVSLARSLAAGWPRSQPGCASLECLLSPLLPVSSERLQFTLITIFFSGSPFAPFILLRLSTPTSITPVDETGRVRLGETWKSMTPGHPPSPPNH